MAYIGKEILIVGDGDMSFAASAAHHVLAPEHLTASVYETWEQFRDKYEKAANSEANNIDGGNVNYHHLKQMGCPIIFGVDATNLDKTEELRKRKGTFDIIIFNFPYPITKSANNAGGMLVDNFLKSAKEYVKPETGEVRVSLVNKQYILWRIGDVLRRNKMYLHESSPFEIDMWKFYATRFGDEREHSTRKADYVRTGNPKTHCFRRIPDDGTYEEVDHQNGCVIGSLEHKQATSGRGELRRLEDMRRRIGASRGGRGRDSRPLPRPLTLQVAALHPLRIFFDMSQYFRQT